MSQTERDPYLGLWGLVRDDQGRVRPAGPVAGQVLSVAPLRIRAAGLDLEGEDLMIPARMRPGWQESLSGLGWGLSATLPYKTLSGSCEIKMTGPDGSTSTYSGTAQVSRPRETVQGKTVDAASAVHGGQTLAEGDLVLLQPSEDGQIYFILDKFLRGDDL